MAWSSMDKTRSLAALFNMIGAASIVSFNCVCRCCASSVSDPRFVSNCQTTLLCCQQNRQRFQQPVIRNRHWCFAWTEFAASGASEAALFLIEAPGGLAIIEQRQQEAFLKAANQLGVRLAPPVQLSGINISKGQNVIIFLRIVLRCLTRMLAKSKKREQSTIDTIIPKMAPSSVSKSLMSLLPTPHAQKNMSQSC